MSTPPAPPLPRWAIAQRWLELLALFGLLPLALAMGWLKLKFGLLLAFATYFGLALLADRRFSAWEGPRFRAWRPLLLRLAVFVWLTMMGVALLAPDWLFSLPRHRPRLMLLIACAYPLVSALPQELIYRTAFFHRYRPIFGDGAPMVVANALLFGWLHLAWGWLTVLVTAIAGVHFALHYRRHRSLLAVTVEHGVVGVWLFAVGLGRFFYLPMS